MRVRATLLILAVAAALVPWAAGAQEGGEFPDDTVAVGLAESGTPTVDVALELSRVTFADAAAEAVVIGRHDLFADSLASGVLQGSAPLLLVPSAGPVPSAVMDEIERLGASRAFLMGGEGAIAPAVASQLTDAGLTVERLEGPTRIETAVDVAQTTAPEATTAIVARAGGVEGNPTSAFADALAAGGWAAEAGMPVLLTQTDVLTQSTADYLAASSITSVFVMGGTAAVSEAVVQALTGMGIAVERVEGADRAETAVATAGERGAPTAETVAAVIVVDGFSEDAWAAGFAAAARSAALDAPIVLGNVEGLPPATSEWLVPGPGALTCAVTRSVCEQARLQLGFPAAFQVSVPHGAVTFTVSDGSTSAVHAALPDGAPVGLAYTCPSATCAELDWTTSGQWAVVAEVGRGVRTLTGDPLVSSNPEGGTDFTSFEVSAGLDSDHFVITRPSSYSVFEFGRGQTGSAGGGTLGEYGTFTTFQSHASHPESLDHRGSWLVQISGELRLRGAGQADGSILNVPAHVQRRQGAQLLGAAWPRLGGGDIAITDDIGGEGLLRIAPYDGGEVVEAAGVDVNSPPYWMPDDASIIVLADTGDGVALVEVDAATGDAETLVADAGDAAGGRIDADPSGTFIAWHAGAEIRVLDTRDGTVASILPPEGQTIVGGPAIRP